MPQKTLIALELTPLPDRVMERVLLFFPDLAMKRYRVFDPDYIGGEVDLRPALISKLREQEYDILFVRKRDQASGLESVFSVPGVRPPRFLCYVSVGHGFLSARAIRKIEAHGTKVILPDSNGRTIIEAMIPELVQITSGINRHLVSLQAGRGDPDVNVVSSPLLEPELWLILGYGTQCLEVMRQAFVHPRIKIKDFVVWLDSNSSPTARRRVLDAARSVGCNVTLEFGHDGLCRAFLRKPKVIWNTLPLCDSEDSAHGKTKGLIDANLLGEMRSDAILVSTSDVEIFNVGHLSAVLPNFEGYCLLDGLGREFEGSNPLPVKESPLYPFFDPRDYDGRFRIYPHCLGSLDTTQEAILKSLLRKLF